MNGQQRLTTLCIFFKALGLKTNQEVVFDRTFRLMDNQQIALDHNHHDKESFNQVVDLQQEVALPQVILSSGRMSTSGSMRTWINYPWLKYATT